MNLNNCSLKRNRKVAACRVYRKLLLLCEASRSFLFYPKYVPHLYVITAVTFFTDFYWTRLYIRHRFFLSTFRMKGVHIELRIFIL